MHVCVFAQTGLARSLSEDAGDFRGRFRICTGLSRVGGGQVFLQTFAYAVQAFPAQSARTGILGLGECGFECLGLVQAVRQDNRRVYGRIAKQVELGKRFEIRWSDASTGWRIDAVLPAQPGPAMRHS